jgi:hypothetical protein
MPDTLGGVVIPPGLCQCGCGQKTKVAKYDNPVRGHVKGEYRRFIRGHREFWTIPEFVIDDSGCWVWQRRKDDFGYAMRPKGGYRSERVHIQNYEEKYGPVPTGKELDHLCRNRACINPEHLEPVPHVVNVRRGRAAKVKESDVLAIRANKVSTHRQLAERFGVNRSTIRKIRYGKTWVGIGNA